MMYIMIIKVYLEINIYLLCNADNGTHNVITPENNAKNAKLDDPILLDVDIEAYPKPNVTDANIINSTIRIIIVLIILFYIY